MVSLLIWGHVFFFPASCVCLLYLSFLFFLPLLFLRLLLLLLLLFLLLVVVVPTVLVADPLVPSCSSTPQKVEA